MSRTVITFMGSSNVGTYLNTISLLSHKYDVGRIIFITLNESPLEFDIDVDKIISQDLYKVFCELSEKKYKGKDISLSEDAKKIYDKSRELISRNKMIDSINYNFFNSEIRKVIKGIEEDVIFDITALPKRIGIDIFIKLLSCGFNNVINFEIKNTKKAKDIENGFLYHLLETESNYELVFLSSEDTFYKNVKYYVLQQEKTNFYKITISLLVSITIVITVFFTQKNTLLNSGLLFLAILSGIIPLVEFLMLSLNKTKKK